ncbi:aminoglycoside 6'-N-acetyltransferase [Rhizobium sp. RU36D]|uniref:aminoglycoside 6'-N-acetyltransferase n=1 Tax=Rhizobium sp. RU36D TaxID=1907415 RepID=UPI0009D7BAEF|nr:aminoglycoside 6'-N-acetyltransferase [Rhizobium sp. RU36D]SMD03298.1 aminoglycoside 6'-N-acetyltransferase I [Rhizobium sp. RU36D]
MTTVTMIMMARKPHVDGWCRLRAQLWPETSEADHRREIGEMLLAPDRLAGFVALAPNGSVAGFAEASLRHDYVNGCDTSPVAFLEGIFVEEDYRRNGIARDLVHAVQDWGRAHGVTELASDADIMNDASITMHGALGFEETERVVYFRKAI